MAIITAFLGIHYLPWAALAVLAKNRICRKW